MKCTFDTTNRKDLVNAIAAISGLEKKYLGVPKCDYQVGPFIISKDCLLTGDDNRGTLLEKILDDLAENYGFHGQIDYDFDVEEEPAEEPAQENEETGLTITLPLDAVKVGNLTNLLEAKGSLIKHALHIEDLRFELHEDTISFPWFSTLPEPDEIHAYTAFLAAIAKMSKEQKRISSTEKAVDNEKYAFRCFLLRLGFIGNEYKADRKILLRNLPGNSAFKGGEGHAITE